ncbi:MAG: 3-hydroxyacyl-CoA dehydrogenase NAD-binding domain-containing protein [Candidatus Korobacteraceae bacterium]|jgi:3-hydroxyacyl-CoA dehydrogenase
MDSDKPIQKIAVVGTGTVGASWAAQFLASGLDVIATDPAPNAEEKLRRYVEAVWPELTILGLATTASTDRLTFTKDVKEAVVEANFVQENTPERIDIKRQLYAQLDYAAPPDSILASSSSALAMSQIQSDCKRPERCVIGHPFNPPHLIPLVEVVGGTRTSASTVERTISFYASIGKKPIRLNKELPGHVANRLQGALYREVAYLIAQGVLDVAAADAAVAWGPGLRWALMGPSLLWHLAGGEGGIEHWMEHLAPGMAERWKILGNPELTPELKKTIVEGVLNEAAGRSVEELARERNFMLLGLLKLKAGSSNGKSE